MSPYRIRLARRDELERLGEIERDAAVRFEPYGLHEVMSAVLTPREALEAGIADEALFVAVTEADVAVGFALATIVDGDAHLTELDVLPEHGRRGLGRALVVAVLAWGVRRGTKRVTLSTLSFVPFNAPYYETLGFRALSPTEIGPELAASASMDRERGLPEDGRVLMGRALPPDFEGASGGEVR